MIHCLVIKAIVFNLVYPFHMSEYIIVPGKIHWRIR
jgi:hypothetical protein